MESPTVSFAVESEFDARVVENFYNTLRRVRELKTMSVRKPGMSTEEQETADLALDDYNNARWSMFRWIERRCEDGV
jgi:hypothetical protein